MHGKAWVLTKNVHITISFSQQHKSIPADTESCIGNTYNKPFSVMSN